MNESNGKAFYQLMLKEFPDILNFEQLCSALNVSPKTGYKILQDKKIAALKVGRSYRVPKVYVLDYLLTAT